MKNRIIVDSCCDLTREMKAEMGITSIPLTMIVDGTEFCDDETLDIADFVDRVKSYKGKVTSASPSPYAYAEAIDGCDDAFIVTLSQKLSGSYTNAVLGNRETVECGGKPACVLDSKTAAAGETLIAIKLYELIKANLPTEAIVSAIHQFIDNMKTYFVLENYTNLQNNGRLSKVTGTLISMLNIRLIMGADGNGEIMLFQKCRGFKQMISHMLFLIESSGKDTQNENLVISHCNNHKLATLLRAYIEERFHFKKIYIVPMGGLSSMYVDDQGVVFAF